MELVDLIKLILKNPLMENGQSMHIDIDFTMPDDMSVSVTPTATQVEPEKEVVEDVQPANEISSLEHLIYVTCADDDRAFDFIKFCRKEHIETLEELKSRRDDIFNPQKHGETTRKYLQEIFIKLVKSEGDQAHPDVPSLDKICDMDELKKIEDKAGHLPVLFIMESALRKYREVASDDAEMYFERNGVFEDTKGSAYIEKVLQKNRETVRLRAQSVEKHIWDGKTGKIKVKSTVYLESLHLIMTKENWEYLLEYVNEGVIDNAALKREQCTMRPEYVIACLKRFFPKDERLEKPAPEKKLTKFGKIEKIMRQYHEEYLEGKHEAKISSQDLFARCQEAYPGEFKNEQRMRQLITNALHDGKGGSIVYHSRNEKPSILWAEDAHYKQQEFRACIVECIKRSATPITLSEIRKQLEHDFIMGDEHSDNRSIEELIRNNSNVVKDNGTYRYEP